LYDLAPVGYVTLSEDALIVEANLTAASLLGVTRSALSARRLSLFVLKDDESVYYSLLLNVSKTRTRQSCELRMTREGATPFWAQLDAALAPKEGAPGWRIVLADVTRRKGAEESLRQSEEQLRRAVDDVREVNASLERQPGAGGIRIFGQP
jgi:PAS domain S-box-containing protein